VLRSRLQVGALIYRAELDYHTNDKVAGHLMRALEVAGARLADSGVTDVVMDAPMRCNLNALGELAGQLKPFRYARPMQIAWRTRQPACRLLAVLVLMQRMPYSRDVFLEGCTMHFGALELTVKYYVVQPCSYPNTYCIGG
jgi:hypothetical protein